MTASEWHQAHRIWPHWARKLYARYRLAYEDDVLGMAYWKQVAKT